MFCRQPSPYLGVRARNRKIIEVSSRQWLQAHALSYENDPSKVVSFFAHCALPQLASNAKF
jgi:hypothetical protein